MSKLSTFTKGLIKENPVLVLVLGTCPTLATTIVAKNGVGMGLAATLVLVCSNMAISAMRNIIPDKVRIPAYIVTIAGFVSVVQMLVKAYAPDLDKALGIFLPLIVVNCIILGRAEMFACKNGVIDSGLDGLGMGLGFTLALLAMGSIREIFGAGTWFGMAVPVLVNYHVPIICLAPGGFFVFGCLIAAVNKFSNGKAIKKKSFSCEGCSNCSACSGTCESKEAAK